MNQAVQINASKTPCHICGQAVYEWGEFTAHGLDFRDEEASWFRKAFTATYHIPARRCLTCGNLQLFVSD